MEEFTLNHFVQEVMHAVSYGLLVFCAFVSLSTLIVGAMLAPVRSSSKSSHTPSTSQAEPT